jgi:addiction module HigA family antidote
MKETVPKPSQILRKQFLRPLGISAYKVAKDTGLLHATLTEIKRRDQAITVKTAIILARYFGNAPEFWLGIQNAYDIEKWTWKLRKKLDKIKPLNQETQPDKPSNPEHVIEKEISTSSESESEKEVSTSN